MVDEPDPSIAALLAENVMLLQLIIEISAALRNDPKYAHLCGRIDDYHDGRATPC